LGNLWIGTFSYSGVHFIDSKDGSLLRYDIQAGNKFRFKSVFVVSIFEDLSGNMWLGTNGAGIFKYAKTKSKFGHIHQNNNSNFKIHSKSVRGILEDSKNRLWVAGYGGLDVFDLNTGESRFVGIWGPGKPSNSLFVPTWFVYEDSIEGEDIYWIGTEGDGLYRYNYKTNFLDEYYYPIESKYANALKFQHSINTNHPYRMLRDRDKQLWITTSTGFEKFDPSKRSFTEVPLPDASCSVIPSNIVEPVNNNDHFWLSTWECGLLLYNKKTSVYHHILPKPNDTTSLAARIIYTLMEDQNQNLWIGTNNGISVLDLKNINYEAADPTVNVKFKNYTVDDGLANNHIYGILEGNNSEMWISSNKGLSVLNTKTRTVKNFDTDDGVQDLEFNRHAYVKAPDGKLYFGGKNGINFFYPNQISTNQNIPTIVFTNFNVLNEPFDIIDEKGGIVNISEVESIQLTHDQNIVSFEFAALEFTEPNKNQYAYKLDGFNKDWINIGNKREAVYTNLDYGSYTFKVKASNNDGVWNEKGASIKLIIHPPWWKTNWAIAIWVILFIIFNIVAFQFLRNRIRMQEKLKMGEEQVEKLKELDQVKSNFFANISHEFRTPLTLILSPLKFLSSKTKNPETLQEYKVIEKNANKLLQLINQILDISKLESKALTANLEKLDLIRLLRGNIAAFHSMAESREIEYAYHFQVNSLVTEIDKSHLEMIVNNLLSNAFKFTPDGEKIMVELEVLSIKGNKILEKRLNATSINFVKLNFIDTGIGIGQENLKHIFDRFYQVDQSSKGAYEGTGIGLSFVKELVEFYKGTIHIKSEEGKGTNVEIIFPLTKVYSVNDAIAAEENIDQEIETFGVSNKTPFDKSFSSILNKYANKKNCILVVEDNEDLRHHIRKILNGDYKLLESENGQKGYETALEEIPDLIISDVMMPVMDGLEMTEKLKSNEITSHIPIILLTAKAAKENKLEGLKTGADDYLAKPFDIDELKIRIENLIKTRSRLQKQLGSQNYIELTSVDITSLDQEFLKRIIETIEDNIDDNLYSVEDLTKEVGMSRTQLHRKITALTDQSTTHFIRAIRLQRAAEILKQGGGNISEVAYLVGFSSRSYFTRCFIEHFGVSPSDYIK